jgi:hypothetical protein
MTHLRDVKQIKDITLDLFPGMKENILLFKKHIEYVDMEPNVDYNLKCDTAKTFLIEVSDKAMRQVKEQILPLQKMEGDNVKYNKEVFYSRVLKFRIEFSKELPFHVQQSSMRVIDDAYAKIGEYYTKL